MGVVYQNPDYQLFMPTVEKEIKFGAKSDEYADEIAEKFGVNRQTLRDFLRNTFPDWRKYRYIK